MSVLLNITMPKTCEVCPCNDDNWRCGATKEYFDYDDMCERRRADCPLIEVPPHGRLIDADALINELASEHVGGLEAIKKYTNADTWTAGLHTAWRTIDDADTVIEAEE